MAWSLCWAGVSIVVVLFLLATLTPFPTLPPRLWEESTEPQSIAGVRQNKAPMCPRCNSLQCLLRRPRLPGHAVFQPCPPTRLPVREVPRPHQLGGCRSGGSSSLLACACVVFCFASTSWADSAYADHLRGMGWGGASWIMWLLRNVLGFVEVGDWWLPAVRHTRLPNTWLVPCHVELAGIFPFRARLARLWILELCSVWKIPLLRRTRYGMHAISEKILDMHLINSLLSGQAGLWWCPWSLAFLVKFIVSLVFYPTYCLF